MSENPFVIVIGREFGAGGRSVGRQLAGRLRIPYYDKELLSQAAHRMGLRKDLFEQKDEHRPSVIQSLLNFHFGSGSYSSSGITPEEIYRAQSDVIRQLAAEGSAVFVGRTADYILRDHPHLVSIFLHADLKHRAVSILKRGDAHDLEEAIGLAQKQDRRRENYYNYFTGRKWGAAQSYDLTVNTTDIDSVKLADMLYHNLQIMLNI